MTDQPLRGLHVCVMTSAHPPFDTRIFHRQAKSTREAGARVTLMAPGAPRDLVDGVRFVGLPSWGGRLGRPFRWPVLFAKAWRTKADIYHMHDPELLPWGLLLKYTTRRRVVYDSHEYLQEDVLGKHWIPERLRPAVARLAGAMQRFVLSRLDGAVAVTEDMADGFRRFQPQTVTIRNLPPATESLPRPLKREPVVMYAGLMMTGRGLEILYDTAALVHGRHPESEFHILGPVEWMDMPASENERTAAEWEAVGVRFLGSVPYPEVAPRLASATIGWLPRSPHVRNNLLAWPNKLVEYMAAGLAIVASDLPTQGRIVRETNTGIVVEPLSPNAHADAICHLLETPEEVEQMADSGRKAAETQFTWEREAAKLHALYARITGHGTGSLTV